MMPRIRRSLLGSLFLLCAAIAPAQTVTYTFAGTIKNASNLTTLNTIGAGSTFTATITYDPAASPTYNGTGGYGGPETTYPLVSMNLTVASTANGTWTTGSTGSGRNVDVMNDVYADYVQFSSGALTSSTFAGLTSDGFNVYFGGSNTILNDTAVPATFALTDWDPYGLATQTYMKVYFTNFTQYVTFKLTSTSAPSAVPEPSTYAALAGLAALGVAPRRRRSFPVKP